MSDIDSRAGWAVAGTPVPQVGKLPLPESNGTCGDQKGRSVSLRTAGKPTSDDRLRTIERIFRQSGHGTLSLRCLRIDAA